MNNGDETSAVHSPTVVHVSPVSNNQAIPSPQPAQGDNTSLPTLAAAAPQPYYNSFVGQLPSQTFAYTPYPVTNQILVATNPHCNGYAEKSLVEAYLLGASPLGILGAHHFYLQRHYWGILYFFTGALLGFGYLFDLFRMPCLVKQANKNIRNHNKVDKTLSDAYTLWFPFGLLGFHHYYLENYGWGLAYTFTGGLFGLGWLADVVRMPWLVKSSNERLATSTGEKNMCFAVGLSVSPFGMLGAHHYYLNRPVWGMVYTFTGGLCGIGWLADCCRTAVLVKRANNIILGKQDHNLKTIDDAYILWFPFGILGFHHFYLQRPLWGCLYLFTWGILGIGWLIDMCRIPSLVRETNAKLRAEQERLRPLASSTNYMATPPMFIAHATPQGYVNYGMANPAASTSTHPPEYYPPPAPFNFQQTANVYPSPYQGPQHAYVPPTEPYNPTDYPGVAPPPYQLAVPDTHPAEELPKKV